MDRNKQPYKQDRCDDLTKGHCSLHEPIGIGEVACRNNTQIRARKGKSQPQLGIFPCDIFCYAKSLILNHRYDQNSITRVPDRLSFD